MLINSAPMIAALTAATKRGVLIKNTTFIETLSEVDTVFFDKTGTITQGNLRVDHCVIAPGIDERLVMETALAVATRSRHPLSAAIAALREGYEVDEGYEITERGGMGVMGVKEGSMIMLGSEKFMEQHAIAVPEALHQEVTCDYVAKNGALLAALCFSDTLRPETPQMISDLREMNIGTISLLTGDREAIAREYKEKCGLTEVYAQLLPEDKQKIVTETKENDYVAFIGDGINDALALSAADVGIAMGAMGVDTAIQSADIALMNENLSNIPFVFCLARETKKVIHQNIVIAFSTSFVMIGLALLGLMPALPGALLHNIGAFLVLLNSGRLIRMEMRANALPPDENDDLLPGENEYISYE